MKHILLALHGENRKMLQKLYVDRQIYISSISSSMQPVEEEKVYTWHDFRFRFMGTGMRRPERMTMLIYIPKRMVDVTQEAPAACEDFLLRSLSPLVNAFSEEMENDHKDSRTKARFEAQEVNECIRRRSGLLYSEETESYVFRILFYMPLINGTSVNAKSGFRAVRRVLEIVEEGVGNLDRQALEQHISVYRRQEELRKWLLDNRFVAFVADGSILPRQGGSVEPLRDAVPFCSPEGLRKTVSFSDGASISGMALPEGVTVITGGGYSGKSTLLDALETGIYHHIPGDGREYVVSLPSSAKIYAEDGRIVQETDLSLFFQNGMTQKDFRRFETERASGSVSQAVNILEALYAGAKALLIDEDTSATNFMIRDNAIRRLVHKEPIIPFTDRVQGLYRQAGISTILVIGGSGEYLQHADRCLLMEDYRIRDVTDTAKQISAGKEVYDLPLEEAGLIQKRWFRRPDHGMPYYISRLVSIDRARCIQIDRYSSDVARLTAIESQDQLHTLTYLLEHCFTMQQEDEAECRSLAESLAAGLFGERLVDQIQSDNYQFSLWLEEIRPMELVGAMLRLREDEN